MSVIAEATFTFEKAEACELRADTLFLFLGELHRGPSKPTPLTMRRMLSLGLLFAIGFLCSCKRLECPLVEQSGCPPEIISPRVDALNRLRNAVNAEFGYRNGVPRINLGPCGPFARAFYDQWNARFEDKTIIAFVMAKEGSFCHHILLKLPDGTFYDGGNGVISREALLKLYSGSRIEEMSQFDVNLLDQRSHGLVRDYPECPNYSEETAIRLITSHLDLLPFDRDHVER